MDLSPVSPSSSQPLEVSQPGRTVARRLTAPITIISICQTILQVAETPEVGDYIGEALHQLTIMERTSIRSFARKLSHLCDKNDEVPITAASPPLTAETESSRATLIHGDAPNLILDDNDAGPNSIGATNPLEPSISTKKVLDTSRRGDTNGITRDPVCRALSATKPSVASYTNKRVMQHPDEDTYSCGALVIKNARDRMIGRLVAAQSSHTYDATELRMGALRILQSARHDHVLTVAPMEEEARKRKFNSSINSNTHKRQKRRETGKEHGLRLVTS